MKFFEWLACTSALSLALSSAPVVAQTPSEDANVVNCIVNVERYNRKVPGQPLPHDPPVPQVWLANVTFVLPVIDGEAKPCFYDFKISSKYISSYQHNEMNCGTSEFTVTCTGFALDFRFLRVYMKDYEYNAESPPYAVTDYVFGVETIWTHYGHPMLMPVSIKG